MVRGIKRDPPPLASLRLVVRPEDGAHVVMHRGKLLAFRHPGESHRDWQVWHRHRFVAATAAEAAAFDQLLPGVLGG